MKRPDVDPPAAQKGRHSLRVQLDLCPEISMKRYEPVPAIVALHHVQPFLIA